MVALISSTILSSDNGGGIGPAPEAPATEGDVTVPATAGAAMDVVVEGTVTEDPVDILQETGKPPN